MSLPSTYWSKDEVEERAIARFLAYLNQSRRSDFALMRRHVSTGGGSPKNFDALLMNTAGWRIAMDIFGLHRPNKEEADVRYFDSLGILICRDLEQLGVKKAWVIFGHRVKQFRGRIQHVAAELAGEIAAMLASPSTPSEFEIRGIKVKTDGVFDGLSHDRFKSRNGDGFDVVLDHLNDLLPEKNKQLATTADERIVLMGMTFPFGDEVIARAVAAANVSQYSNIEKLIYERSQGQYLSLYPEAWEV